MQAYCNEDFEVEEMLIKLSSILRYVLVKSTEPVTLEQELACIQTYLEICNVSSRYPVRLEVGYEPACKKALMPRMTLQPLVENSIKHGGLREMEGGCVSILGYVEEDGCHIKITDNGRGCSQETLRELRTAMENKKEPEGSGHSSELGLYNVHRRLQLMFGEEYGIEMDARATQGFLIHLHVPMSDREGDIE